MAFTVPLDSTFGPQDLDLLRQLGSAADDAGVELYLVGGSVRDALLGRPLVDLDLVSEAAADHVARVLVSSLGGHARARSQFGTIKLELAGRAADLATARSERYIQPGALPQVRPGSLEQDLRRRDFSINAMAVSLRPSRWGELADPMGGRKDLERKVVRALHKESFRDDATRILRAARYAERLGFRLQRRTLDWMWRDLSYLDAISPARLRRELERMLREERAARCLLRAHRMGALGAIHSSLGRREVAQALRKAGREAHEPLALLGLLTYSGDALAAEAVARRVGLTVRQRRVLRDVQLLKDLGQELARPSLSPHRVVAHVGSAEPAAVQAAATLAASGRARGRLRRYLERWRGIRPWLRGADLLGLGVPSGPAVGQLLRELRDQRLDGRIRSRRGEVAFVRSLLGRESRRA